MDEYQVDEGLLEELYRVIRMEEGQNLKSGKRSDQDMRKMIQSEISKIVDKEGN
ncbi:MAG: hypothetical protein K2M46_07260 [Lachnospiraceae bacterium]|nr:hypothetical protein [Lachnospiraceae bacterium]